MSNFLADVFSSPDTVRNRYLERYNDHSRLPYLGDQTDKFFASYRHMFSSTVVSGGSAASRAAVIHGIIRMYAESHVPVLVLHCGNRWLSCPEVATGAVLPDGNMYRCDPLLGSTADNLVELLSDLSDSLMPAQEALGELWELLADVYFRGTVSITLPDLCAISCKNLPAELAKRSREGLLDEEETCSLLERLNALPAGTLGRGDQLLRKLRRSSMNIPQAEQPPVGMAQIVTVGGIASIDLVSDSNLAVKELCFLVLRRMMENGQKFLVVCDGLSLTEQTKQMKLFLSGISSNVHFLFAGQDVPAQLSAGPELMDQLMEKGDGGTNAVIFSHTSPTGKEFWLRYLGKYRHRYLEHSYTYGKDSTAIFRHTEGRSAVYKEETRDVMEEEELRKLPEGCAVVVMPARRRRGILLFENGQLAKPR